MPSKVLSAERISDSSSAAESSSEESSSDGSEGEQERESRPSDSAQQKRKSPSPQTNSAKRLKKTDSTPHKPNGTSNPPAHQKSSSPQSSSSEDEPESPAKDSSNQASTASSKYVTPAETPTANGHATPQTPPQDAAPPKNTRIKPTWKPPKGFEPASKPTNQPPELSALFSRDALSDKQIWHITAPASVPLSALAELAPDQLKGHVCLSHAGHDYAFRPTATSSTHKTLPMAPGPDSGFFRAMGPGGFDQVLHLHQVLTSEAGGHAIAGKSNGASARGRKPREQPKGLRTRWWAAGFEDGDEREERAVAGMPGAPQVQRPDSKSGSSSSDESSSEDDEEDSSSDSDSDDDSSDSGSSSKEEVAGTENKSPAAKPASSDASDSSGSSSSSSSGSDSDDHDSDSDDE